MFTREEIFEALTNNNSAEYDSAYGGITYYLHITNAGEILSSYERADKTFTYTIKTSEQDNYFHSDRCKRLESEIGRIEFEIDKAMKNDNYDMYQELRKELATLKEYPGDEYCYTMDDYYNKESVSDFDFMKVVEFLTNATNKYLESLK